MPKEKIKEEEESFAKSLMGNSYLSEEQKEAIDQIKLRFDAYLKKAGKSGVENFNEWFFTELTYNSNAIEGSSLGPRETSMIIYENIIPKNTLLREVNEARNHKEALEFLLLYKGDINEHLILKLHSILLKNIDERRGTYRTVPVFIMGSDVQFPRHSNVPTLMKALIRWYKSSKRMYPTELAALFSMKFVSIHPFTDGNGRVSRLLMNYILKKNGYPEINIYVKSRNNYLKAVRKANDGDYIMIVDFLLSTMKKNYKFLAEV
ncbi:MAG: Fic family protein [Candidatus Aenigmarchaeota archaeon]|nr:Fic family protein [Candidatus Aenigmarchaeota archaeon]